jgi:ketosteroid isomerase-like protein
MKRHAVLVWTVFTTLGLTPAASLAQAGGGSTTQSNVSGGVDFVLVPKPGQEDTARAEQVMKVDEDFRRAKLASDVPALDRILSDDYIGLNQTGNVRDKQALLELFTWFRISSLVTNRANVRFSGDMAIVTGEQTEVSGTSDYPMLFTRIYVKGASGQWQLLSSTQYRDPKLTVNAGR